MATPDDPPQTARADAARADAARHGAGRHESVLAKTARGAGWMVGWQITTRLLGLFSTLVLARLLVPADFGVVAIALTFIQAIETLSFLGVEEALVREHAPGRAMYDTGFTLNMIRSVAIALLLAAGAGPSARFFSEPRLDDVLLVLALGVAVSGFNNIGTVDFRRDFDFGAEFRLMILPRLISTALTLAVAFGLHSYWALVVGQVAMRFTRIAASYVMHPYRPRLSLAAWRPLLGYSLWTWAQTTALVIRDRSSMFVIGRLLGPQAAGVYAVGADIALMPSTELVGPMTRVVFSGFAASRTPEGGGETYLRVAASMALLTMPMGFGLSACADAVVRLGFGPGWEAAVPIIRIIAPAGAVLVFGYLSSTLFFAHAHMAKCFRVTAIAAATRVGLLALLIPGYGLTGAAAAMAVSVLVETALFLYLVCRHYAVAPRRLLERSWRCFAATAAMVVALRASGLGWTPIPGSAADAVIRLIAEVSLGAVVYLGVVLAAWLAQGRPQGGEADWLRVLAQARDDLLARLHRTTARRT